MLDVARKIAKNTPDRSTGMHIALSAIHNLDAHKLDRRRLAPFILLPPLVGASLRLAVLEVALSVALVLADTGDVGLLTALRGS